MNRYSSIPNLPLQTSPDDYEQQVIKPLIDSWLNDYYSTGTTNHTIVETEYSGFSYLFDITSSRLIAAWGFSTGKNTEPRPKKRMAGAPIGAGPNYHRGHAVAHTLGGGTDINLVPQLGAVNSGPFKSLEREAANTPGALYFTYWIYQDSTSQLPLSVEQGLLKPGSWLEVRSFAN